MPNAVSTPDAPPLDPNAVSGDAMWLEVIRKMDETYADLVGHQVALEHKNAELLEAHAFIDDVMGAMTDLLVAFDGAGIVTKVNRAFERAVGEQAADLLGRPVANLFDRPSARQLAEVPAALRALGRIEDRAMSLRTPGGPFPLAVNLSPLADRRGRHLGVVLVGRPVGELKKAYADLAAAHRDLRGAQNRLVHSEKMASLGRLVAGVAHEINNPMSFVYGNAHTMRRYGERLTRYLEALHAAPGKAPALRQELRIDALLADLPGVLDAIMEGAERSRDIVESLRRYASGQAETREKVDLVALIQTAVRWVAKGQAPDADIRFTMPAALEVEAHSGGIQQVVMNIVQNALDAQGNIPAPRLEIALAVEQGQAVARFRDFGHGIDTKHRTRIFDPFFTTKPVGRGTGLGLSISFEIVKGHGGSIEADNHPGGGAVFSLRLPLPEGP